MCARALVLKLRSIGETIFAEVAQCHKAVVDACTSPGLDVTYNSSACLFPSRFSLWRPDSTPNMYGVFRKPEHIHICSWCRKMV